MRPRQEAERPVVTRDKIFREDRTETHDVGDDVSVREHHTLGLSRRTRGVDQGC